MPSTSNEMLGIDFDASLDLVARDVRIRGYLLPPQ